MKVVIDTNVMLICISTKSKVNAIFQHLVLGNLELCLSTEIMLEYEEIFEQNSGAKGKELLEDIIFYLPKTSYFQPYFVWNLIAKDPDDNKFVDCAIVANADYIITDDKHFNALSEIDFPKVNVISSTDFVKLIAPNI